MLMKIYIINIFEVPFFFKRFISFQLNQYRHICTTYMRSYIDVDMNAGLLLHSNSVSLDLFRTLPRFSF